MNDSGFFSALKFLVKQGVYCIINEVDKKVLLGYSNYIPEAVAKLMKRVQEDRYSNPELKSDFVKLEFRILEKVEGSFAQKIAINHWMKYFEELGYSFYNKYTPIAVTPRLTLDPENKVVKVFLVSNRNNKLLVGKFSNMIDAKNWIQDNYPDTSPRRLVTWGL